MTKKPSPEKTLTNILEHDPASVLAFIQSKVQQLINLNQIWRTVIPNELNEHTRVANFREGHLIIECDSGAWATRLRYLLPDIKQKLLNYPDLHPLVQIEWGIQPEFHTQPIPLKSLPLTLSDTNAELLKNAAETIRTKPLQEALLRIAEHVK